MKVETVAIKSLTTDPENARKHSQKNIDAISGSLTTFGQRKPLVVWDNIVIAGNGTIEAAKSLGWEKIEITRVPSDWTHEQARAYALADNRTAELAEWDAEILANQLIELDAIGYEISDWGFEPLSPPTDPISDEELDGTISEPPANPVARLGDIYKIGRHTVICGDATDPETYKRLLQSTEVNMIWTDPPYGVSYIGKTSDALTIQNDDLTADQLQALLSSAFEQTYAACAPGGAWYVASPAGDLFHTFGNVLLNLGVWRHTLIWEKDMFVMGRADYHYRHEPIFYGWKKGAAHTWNGGRKQDSILQINRPKQSKDHPTMKPVELIRRCIENSSNPNENILDPFAGSGSTLLAAEATGRIGYGIELDPRYVDVIVRRLEQATSSEASKL